MTTLTSAQLDKIADCIFILRDRKLTRLKKPVTFQTFAFEHAMDPIAATPTSRTLASASSTSPATRRLPTSASIHGDKPFRIGSTDQDRDDAGCRSTANRCPQYPRSLAADHHHRRGIRRAVREPRAVDQGQGAGEQQRRSHRKGPSAVLEDLRLQKSPVDFAGPDVDTQHRAANHDKAFNKLGGDKHVGDKHHFRSRNATGWPA